MRILIIANARYKGGLSGSDAIYENFLRHWEGEIYVKTMQEIDYRPFWICYLHRILLACFRSLRDFNAYSFVYSASDFLPDVLPAFILRLKGNRWAAGFYLEAFKENKIHFYTQKLAKLIINKFAGMVIVANPTMYKVFPNKKKTWINGGVDLYLAGLSDAPKIFDAVFCGRIHPSKGIDELVDIWKKVRQLRPDATLAVIGDGDLGRRYIIDRVKDEQGNFCGMTLFGYMGGERFSVYKRSRVVLYPTPLKYNHFSIAPIEAMACGCPMIAFNLPVMQEFENNMGLKGCALIDSYNTDIFAYAVVDYINGRYKRKVLEAYDWAQQWDYKKQATRVRGEIDDCFGF